MIERSYIGIDSTDNNEWIAVLWVGDEIMLSRPFQKTPAGLDALVRFIIKRCDKPKICLTLTNPSTLSLIKYIGCIPDVEVMLVSSAGFRFYRAGFNREILAPFTKNYEHQAYLLARCAGRMA